MWHGKHQRCRLLLVYIRDTDFSRANQGEKLTLMLWIANLRINLMHAQVFPTQRFQVLWIVWFLRLRHAPCERVALSILVYINLLDDPRSDPFDSFHELGIALPNEDYVLFLALKAGFFHLLDPGCIPLRLGLLFIVFEFVRVALVVLLVERI